MSKYYIEHRIFTLAHCAIMRGLKKPASFIVQNIEFSHENFNFSSGWLSNNWIASETVEQPNALSAINLFRDKLQRIVPRISLISQAYAEYVSEPFLIHKIGEASAIFRYIKDSKPVGLMFNKEHKTSLEKLLGDVGISEEFYLYWKDATNATGYSAKLLLMFSGIEALAKKKNGKKDWTKITDILGQDLKDEIFAPRKGLRHRLAHGEYFQDVDNGKDYLTLIHHKVIQYFNSKILMSRNLSENVVNPQRNPFVNKKGVIFIVEITDGATQLGISELSESFDGYKFASDRFRVAANQDLKRY